jgi:hypothetical protein
VGGTTIDGTAPDTGTWTNIGPIPTNAIAAAGGTSGIVIDNTVATGMGAGASQVYFSTLAGCGKTTAGLKMLSKVSRFV